jgi:hypothetical protein
LSALPLLSSFSCLCLRVIRVILTLLSPICCLCCVSCRVLHQRTMCYHYV